MGAVVLEWFIPEIGPGRYVEQGKLTDTQKASISAMMESWKFLTSWAIGVLGATVFFFKLNVEKSLALGRFDLIISFIIILFAILSLFLGHLLVERSISILAIDQFPWNDRVVRELVRFQYVFVLLAIALFGFHAFRYFWLRQQRDN